MIPEKEWLYSQYIIQKKSLREVGKLLGVSIMPVRSWLKKYGIVQSAELLKEKLSRSRSGEKNPMYGHHHSESARQKISAAHVGMPGPNKGKPMSDETRRKLSETKIARYAQGATHPWTGRHHSDETKARLRSARLGFKHSPETRAKMSVMRKGELSSSWKGGRRLNGGYVYVHMPKHPFADGHGYVPEHRLVIERAIGRFLKLSEMPHHVDENRSNNAPNNLVLCQDRAYHNLLHARIHRLEKREILGGERP
jgi:hypothetical protein